MERIQMEVLLPKEGGCSVRRGLYLTVQGEGASFLMEGHFTGVKADSSRMFLVKSHASATFFLRTNPRCVSGAS